MIVLILTKLKTLSLTKQVVTGAFINSALIGGAVVAGTLIAGKARFGCYGICKTAKATVPQDQWAARSICAGAQSSKA